MRHVFAFQVHEVTTVYGYVLSKLARSKDVTCLVHVDAKSNVEEFDHERAGEWLLESRIPVSWGGYSQVLATIRLMRSALECEFDYFSLLSGDDLFLGDVETFSAFLAQYPDTDFIDTNSGPVETKIIRDRCAITYSPALRRKSKNFFATAWFQLWRFVRLQLAVRQVSLAELPVLSKGCNWFTVTRNFVEEFISFYDANRVSIDAFFRYTHCSDEIVFASFADSYRRPHLAKRLFNDFDKEELALRYADWTRGPDYPRKLSLTDIDGVLHHPHIFFVRKIDRTIPRDELENIDIKRSRT